MAVARQRVRSQSVKGWFFLKALPFLKRYGLIIIVLTFGLPPLIRYIRTQIALLKGNTIDNKTIVNNAENGVASPVIVKQKITVIKKKYPNLTATDMERMSTVAQGVALALGTNVQDNHFVFSTDLYNVGAWVENEDEVIRLLKTVPSTFPVVEDLYYSVHTRSRNLKNDLLKYLSKSDLEQIRKVYKKYGKTFL